MCLRVTAYPHLSTTFRVCRSFETGYVRQGKYVCRFVHAFSLCLSAVLLFEKVGHIGFCTCKDVLCFVLCTALRGLYLLRRRGDVGPCRRNIFSCDRVPFCCPLLPPRHCFALLFLFYSHCLSHSHSLHPPSCLAV